MVFHVKTPLTTDALVGLLCVSERVTGMPSGSATSMASSRVSPDTAK